MKKIFGLVMASENIELIFAVNQCLYKKISNMVGNFYILNLIHFMNNGFNSKKVDVKDNILPDNIKIITPKNLTELKNFLSDKKFIAFNNIGKGFEYFRILYLIKKYKVKLILLQNLSSDGNKISGEKNKKNLINFFFRIKRYFNFVLFRILTIVGIFPKIEIYFESRKDIVERLSNSFTKKIDRQIPFLGLSYFKKIIQINSRSYDLLSNDKSIIEEDKIIFVDSNFESGDRIEREGNIDENLKLKYFNDLSIFLEKLSNLYNKDVVICLHPKSQYDLYKKHLNKFELIKFQTSKLIRKAVIVIFHDSSSISDALILKKKIMCLNSKSLGTYMSYRINYYLRTLNLVEFSLDKENEFKDNELLKLLENQKKNYDKYIKDFLICDGEILGEDKVTKIIIEENF